MLRKIRLYGELAKAVGERVLYADVRSAAQTVRFLIANWPELEKHISERSYKVTADEWELDETELNYPIGNSDIKIIPVIGGAGNNTTKIIIGVALIGAAIFIPGAALFAGGTLGFGVTGTGMAATALAFAGNVGLLMAISGIAGLLSPVPDVDEGGQDPRRSFSFSGIQNTSRAGVAIPVIYGQVLTGSVVISAGVATVQVEV